MEHPCPGCNTPVAHRDGPGHRYVNASAACWATYGEVLAGEFGNPTIFAGCHELSVDAYIAQHPGGNHPTRSLVVHLAGLYFQLERGVAASRIPNARATLVERVWHGPDPTPPDTWGSLNVTDLAAVAGTDRHIDVIHAYAREVWDAWQHEHARVEAFVNGT